MPAPHRPPRLTPLISGGGSTVLNLHSRIADGRLRAEVPLVLASRECDGVARLRDRGLNVEVISRKSFPSVESFSETLFSRLRDVESQIVPLSGFLSRILIPADFQQRVINIHPSLIPAFCGQGMYGHYVHEAVLARGCKVSGCTVHFCDNEYDHGPIILQQSVSVMDDDTPDTLAARVFAAECEAYPQAIEWLASGQLRIRDGKVVREVP